MFKVSIEDKISSAHFLRGHDGKCAELHGHNWKVIVRIQTENLDDVGLAIDFYDLKAITKKIINRLDHKNLNDLDYFAQHNPSSENIAKYLYAEIKEHLPGGVTMSEVEVVESEGCTVVYSEREE